jgi:hypothetical protein
MVVFFCVSPSTKTNLNPSLLETITDTELSQTDTVFVDSHIILMPSGIEAEEGERDMGALGRYA